MANCSSSTDIPDEGPSRVHDFFYKEAWYRISIDAMRATRVGREAYSLPASQGGDPEDSRLPGNAPVSDSLPAEHPVAGMDLFIAQSCNLACRYCYGKSGTYGDRGLMSAATALRAVDWLFEVSGPVRTLRINFFGGEPLLNFPVMETVVGHAKAKGSIGGKKVLFQVTTNGTMLDEKVIGFFREHKFKVLVSLDGPREIHDRQRIFADGSGSYDAIVRHLAPLISSVPDTDAHAVIMGDTDPKTVIDSLAGFGFRGISLLPASGSLFEGTASGAGQRDSAAIFRQMEQEAGLWVKLAKTRDSEGLELLKSYSQFSAGLKSFLHNRKSYHPCGAAIGLAAVSCSGVIYPCHRFVGQESFRIGHISGQELQRTEFLKSPVMTNELCIGCFARYYCAGGCKQDNYISGGSLCTPSDDMCRLRRRQFELAAFIVAELDDEDRRFLQQKGIVPPKPCPLDF